MTSIRSLFAALLLAPAVLVGQATPAAPAAPADAGNRPMITVGAFDYGTVAAQIATDRATRRRLERMGVTDAGHFAEALGVGAADLIVEELLKSGAFRVLERRQLDAIKQEQSIQPDSITSASPTRVARARYIITGSVTRLGFEEKHLGGLVGRAAGAVWAAGLGAKKNNTFVNLTARVIDTETGEIIASFTGEGLSTKGWGLTIFGMGGWGLGGAKAGSENIRETAIGEATAEAASQIAARITEMRTRMASGS